MEAIIIMKKKMSRTQRMVCEATESMNHVIALSKSNTEVIFANYISVIENNKALAGSGVLKYIHTDLIKQYMTALVRIKTTINKVFDDSFNFIKEIYEARPKDNYDNMTKEELIALLRNKK